jgi:hypothetical protein
MAGGQFWTRATLHGTIRRVVLEKFYQKIASLEKGWGLGGSLRSRDN